MKYTVIGLIVVAVAYLGFFQEVYTNFGYINIYTGSTKGHTQVMLLGEVNNWERKSELANRLDKINGIQILEDYVSYNGTGKTLFGISRSYGHGNPGHAIYLAGTTFDKIIKACTDDEIEELYKINLRKDGKAFNDWILKMIRK
jgi:hypothetical protein